LLQFVCPYDDDDDDDDALAQIEPHSCLTLSLCNKKQALLTKIAVHLFYSKSCNRNAAVQQALLFLADIDECRERPGICSNGECNNFQGSFQCICQNGYQLTPSRDSCLDIDECKRHPNICNNGSCANTVGSYKCHCYPGFKLSHNNDCTGTFCSKLFFTLMTLLLL
jgi:fibulin 1/2